MSFARLLVPLNRTLEFLCFTYQILYLSGPKTTSDAYTSDPVDSLEKWSPFA